VTCDLDRLVDTRLLVQANSGGGKSWLLRRLLEQTHGHVQHLVIDPEGEFASLREKFDYVLAARTAATPRRIRARRAARRAAARAEGVGDPRHLRAEAARARRGS
jgi:DNA helicase HerA-like ATPase